MLKPYLELPRAVYILCVGTFINRAGSFLIPFLTIYLESQRGFGKAQATQALSFCGLGAMSAAILGGHLADSIGRRRVMAMSLVGNAAVLLLFSRLHTAWLILPTLLLFNLLADTYRPAASAMIGGIL